MSAQQEDPVRWFDAIGSCQECRKPYSARAIPSAPPARTAPEAP